MRRLDKNDLKLDNTVIEAKSEKKAKAIVKLFARLGYDTNNYTGTNWSAKYDSEKVFYGIMEGRFSHYVLEELKGSSVEICKLPNKKEMSGKVIGGLLQEAITKVEGLERSSAEILHKLEISNQLITQLKSRLNEEL